MIKKHVDGFGAVSSRVVAIVAFRLFGSFFFNTSTVVLGMSKLKSRKSTIGDFHVAFKNPASRFEGCGRVGEAIARAENVVRRVRHRRFRLETVSRSRV